MRSLGTAGVPIVAVHQEPAEFAHRSRFVTAAVRSPGPEAAEEAFVVFLEHLAVRFGRGLLLPTSDETLAVVARHRDRLAEAHAVGCPAPALVATFIDKRRTYEAATGLGVPVPRTFAPVSAGELERNGEEVGYPCLVKPRESHLYFARFGRKMVKAEGLAELRSAWQEATDAGLGVLVQEFVPGSDRSGANYNAYLEGGRALAECTAQKIRLAPEEIGFPRVVVSREIPEIAALGRRLLTGMGVTGFANVEFKRHGGDGSYRLMEVNARHNMSTLLSVRSGVDFPLIMYRHLIQGSAPPPARSRPGVHWINPVSDLGRLVRDGGWTRGYLRPYFSPHVFDVLDRRDPWPFAMTMRGVVPRLLSRPGRPARGARPPR